MSSDLQRQARALGNPTRYAIFRYLVQADRPIDVSELADHLGVHPNAVRQHLAQLLDAALVTEGKAATSGRGRPRLQYRVVPAADERWSAGGPYERLSILLSEIIRTGDSPVEVGRRAARRRRLGASGAADPLAELVDQMEEQGFDPVLDRTDDRFEVTLETCPFAATALADPDTVCSLHLGMAYGAVDDVDTVQVDELVPKDPRRAHCLLHGRVTAPAARESTG